MHLEHLKETLRKLCMEVENLAIENTVYFDAILESRTINLPNLKERVAEAQLDPVKRKEVRQMYSEMWKAVEDSGTDAFFEGLLKDLPPTGEPN
jgi:archaellum component FlaC